MKTYSILEYPQKVREYFDFLINEYGYELIEDVHVTFGFITIYQRGDIRIHLYFEIPDKFYYFSLIRGKETRYPNDHDTENIKPFFRLFQKYEPDIDLKKLQPDQNQYLESLELNAQLLKKYGASVLKGEEWI